MVSGLHHALQSPAPANTAGLRHDITLQSASRSQTSELAYIDSIDVNKRRPSFYIYFTSPNDMTNVSYNNY